VVDTSANNFQSVVHVSQMQKSFALCVSCRNIYAVQDWRVLIHGAEEIVVILQHFIAWLGRNALLCPIVQIQRREIGHAAEESFVRGRRLVSHSWRSVCSAEDGRRRYVLYKHRHIVVARRLPIQSILPALPRRFERRPALGAARPCTATPSDTLFSDRWQSISAPQVIESACSAPLGSCASFEETRTLAQNESVQKVTVFPSPTRIAENDLYVASLREDWKLVLRRIPVLAAVVGPRMAMSSSR
jgi:hypothetical protein